MSAALVEPVNYFIAPSMTIFEARGIRTASGSRSNIPRRTFRKMRVPQDGPERRRSDYRHTRTPPTKWHLGATTTARGATTTAPTPTGRTGHATRANHSRRTIDDGVCVAHREDEKQRDDDIFHLRPPCLYSVMAPLRVQPKPCAHLPVRLVVSQCETRTRRCRRLSGQYGRTDEQRVVRYRRLKITGYSTGAKSIKSRNRRRDF